MEESSFEIRPHKGVRYLMPPRMLCAAVSSCGSCIEISGSSFGLTICFLLLPARRLRISPPASSPGGCRTDAEVPVSRLCPSSPCYGLSLCAQAVLLAKLVGGYAEYSRDMHILSCEAPEIKPSGTHGAAGQQQHHLGQRGAKQDD